MAPVGMEWMAFSALTFTFLQATGYYIANLAFAEPWTWGKGEGCGFLTLKAS